MPGSGARPVLNYKLITTTLWLVILVALAIFLAIVFLRFLYPVDLLQYWSAAQIFIAGGNPYDVALLNELQIKAGRPESTDTIVMWNPPLILFLIFPLAFFEFKDAAVAFFVIGGVAICGSFYISRKTLKNPDRILSDRQGLLQIAFLVTFYPAFLCLAYGQISFVLLLAFSAYLYLDSIHKNDHCSSFWAGVALSFTCVKPHLLFLLYLYIFGSSCKRKSWGTVMGIAFGVSLLLLFAFVVNHEIFSFYLASASRPPIYWQTPTLGSWLQGLTGIHEVWVRLLPTLCTALLLVFSMVIHPAFFRLKEAIYLLVPLSLLTSPYGWVYDQMLLLPTAIWIICRSKGIVEADIKVTLLAMLLISSNMIMMFVPAEAGQQVHLWYPAVFFLLVFFLLKQRTASKRSDLGMRPGLT